jgi:hypothetical protein
MVKIKAVAGDADEQPANEDGDHRECGRCARLTR